MHDTTRVADARANARGNARGKASTTTAGTKTQRWSLRKRIALTALVLMVIGYCALRVAQHRSDGPLTDLIPGGELRAGDLVAETAQDWRFLHGETIELQLTTPLRSRYVGIMEHNGVLYIPCDLGYMWGRFSGMIRHTLHLVYRLKRWHKDALEDGRVVVRFADKRYPFEAVRVTDPALLTELRSSLEDLARQWVAPEPLAAAPTDGPRDIWFFRLDPRSS